MNLKNIFFGICFLYSGFYTWKIGYTKGKLGNIDTLEENTLYVGSIIIGSIIFGIYLIRKGWNNED